MRTWRNASRSGARQRVAALAAALLVSGCHRCGSSGPTLEELNAHPARQLSVWGGVPSTPLEQRILVPAPERVIDYLRLDNVFNGYQEVPRQVDVDPALLVDLREAVAELPDEVKRLVAPKLLAIAPVRELGGSALTERVHDGPRKHVVAWVVLDTSVLDRAANDWITWKESSPFARDGKHRVEAVIEEPENDTRKNALQYILLHELGHVVASDSTIHPVWHRPPKNADTSKYSFFNFSWRAVDGETVSIFDDAFTVRSDVYYYVPEERALPAVWAEAVYRGLEKTSFPSLYGATNHQDDFAEGFVTYVHTVLQKRPFEVRIYEEDTLRKTYRACWDEPRCAEKRAFFEALFAGN